MGCALTAPAYVVKATMEIHVSINGAQPRLMERTAVDMVCAKEGPSMGTCTCKTGWGGPGCGVLACPMDCSGNGKCINGKCLCDAKWMGPGCEEYKCPITNGFMCKIMVHVTTALVIVTRLKKMERFSVVITVIKPVIYLIVVFMQMIRKGAVATANASIKFVNAKRVSMANTVAKRNAQQIVTAMVSAATMACVSVT